MRNRISTIVSKLVHRAAFTPSSCLMLEQLEDRYVPSANMMEPMNAPMPPMNMQTAVTHLIGDFDQTMAQVQTSTTVQQFIANEVNMIEVLATDLAQIQMLVAMMGSTMVDPSMVDPSMMDSTMMDSTMMDSTMMDSTMMGTTMMDSTMMGTTMMDSTMMGTMM